MVIPKIKVTIDDIVAQLDEIEREEFYRYVVFITSMFSLQTSLYMYCVGKWR